MKWTKALKFGGFLRKNVVVVFIFGSFVIHVFIEILFGNIQVALQLTVTFYF